MATVEHSAGEIIGKIPLGRRIAEVLHEKGNAFSTRSFAERVGENRETFRQTLLGNRPISITLLEKISNALNVSEERLRQLDTAKKYEDLGKILKANSKTKLMLMRAHSIASELVEVALGSSERGYSLNALGRVQYLQKQYDDAHKTWLKALEFAKINHDEYEDNELLKIVSANLMLTYVIRKEYSNIEDMLQLVENTFDDNPQALGMVYYTRMMVQSDRGHFEEAKKLAYRSLEYYERTNDTKQIGIALNNVAHFEYLLGDYETSAKLLLAAMKVLEQHENYLIIAVKEYVKALMKLQEYDTASRIIEQYVFLAKDYPEYWAKLQILNTVLKDDPSYAERISNDREMDIFLRYLACDCLFEFYAKKGDGETALKYYEKRRIYSSEKSDFYDRRGY